MGRRDYQRSKVYRWENEIVRPRDTKPVVPFTKAQSLVNAIWMAEGLHHPPRVEPMPMQARRVLATGSRTTVRLPPVVPTYVLLHEIAHAMTSDLDDGDRHGPQFVGNYMRLLERFAGIPQPLLWYSAKEQGVDFNMFAKPRSVDAA